MTDRKKDTVQFPLTLFIPIQKDYVGIAKDKIESITGDGPLSTTELIHFARIFMVPDTNTAGISPHLLAIITTYDGNFKDYVDAFVAIPTVRTLFVEIIEIADIPKKVRDEILITRKGEPTTLNPEAFARVMGEYDLTNAATSDWGSWFSAYPRATVKNIQGALKREV